MKKTDLFSVAFASSILLVTCFSFALLSGCLPKEEDELAKFYEGSPEQLNYLNPEEIMEDFDQTAMPEKGQKIVVMKTGMGTIKIKLFPQFAPKTVENFVGLINKKYYDGVTFHRVIPDFMIQGGDPTGTGRGGESVWGIKFADEFNKNLTHLRGALSMANAGPGTNGSQFFIVQSKAGTNFLDGRHSIFGQVFEGMDVIDKIVAVERDDSDKPLKDVVMEEVTIAEY